MQRVLLLAVITAMAAACGKTKHNDRIYSSTASVLQDSGDLEADPSQSDGDVSVDDTSLAVTCGGSAVAYQPGDYPVFSASDMVMEINGNPSDLCDALDEKSVAIIQWVDPNCEPCIEAVRNVFLFLQTSNFQEQIHHIALFPQQSTEVALSSAEDFIKTFTTGIVLAQDNNGQFAKVFTPPAEAPLLLSYNSLLEFADSGDFSETYLDLIPTTELLLQRSLPEVEEKIAVRDLQPSEETAWSGQDHLGTGTFDIIVAQ